MSYCKEHGSYKGMCCCNCKYQVIVKKHAGNKGKAKGKASEVMGFGCNNPEYASHNQVIFMDRKHGMCELHEDKVNK
jgi:hypothetical protein